MCINDKFMPEPEILAYTQKAKEVALGVGHLKAVDNMKETLREAHRGFLSDLAGLCKSYGIDEIKADGDMIVAISHDNRSSVAFAVLRDGVYIAVREQHLASEYNSQTGGEC